jgi:hypothetical protein
MTICNSKIFLLTLIVIGHVFFSASSILFILLYSLGINSVVVDALALGTVISFLIFRRCIAIDIYEYVRGGDTEIPDFARDNFFRKCIQGLLNRENHRKVDMTHHRLDILENIFPIVETCDTETVEMMLNRKNHYIIINIIMAVILLVKYNLKQFLPLLIVWLFLTFPV